MSFQDKTIVITGGAKGIGAGCANIFYREQGNVIILDIDQEAGHKLNRQLGERSRFITCDVGNQQQVKQAMKQTAAEFGGVDILVNNAGYQIDKSVTETSEDEWDALLNVNLKGAFLCAKHAIPYMIEKGSGVVINMSSVQAFVTQKKVAAYVTSKCGLIGLTRSIAIDYAPAVRSVAICPGAVDTPMNRQSFQQAANPGEARQGTMDIHLVGRMAEAEEIGEFVGFVASEKGAFITGQSLRIDGGVGAKIGGNDKG